MSEEIRKMSAFEAFAQTQQTYEEAEQKAKQEAGTPKVERFRTGEDGEYSIRILPLAPSFDEGGNILPMTRKGYEYAIHQFFLAIKVPAKKGGKPKTINIPVIRTTDKEVGYSVDLLDTYVKIAKEKYSDDEELLKFLTGSSYEGGIRWNYQHAIMVLDVTNEKARAKGPQLWQCSHSQYKDIDAAKMRLWAELREDGGQTTCPISGFTDAYPIKVIRKTEKKTEYTIEIGRKTVDIQQAEAEKLLELPRIPELIYRYSRYHLEATLAFLQQYDEAHDMEVCKEPDFMEAVEKLKGELPSDDNSHFDLVGAASKGSDKEEVTVASLWAEYDVIVDQDLGERSDEYQELREKIRQFIEEHDLDVRISRTKNNQQLLEEIDEVYDHNHDKKSVEKVAPEEDAKSPEKAATTDNEVVAPRPRRPRPDDIPEAEEGSAKGADNDSATEPEANEDDGESPRRRLRARRMR